MAGSQPPPKEERSKCAAQRGPGLAQTSVWTLSSRSELTSFCIQPQSRTLFPVVNLSSRFSEHRDEVTFEQVNSSKSSSLSMHTGSVSLSLAEGCMHEVFVSSIVGGGEIAHGLTYGMLVLSKSCCPVLKGSFQFQIVHFLEVIVYPKILFCSNIIFWNIMGWYSSFWSSRNHLD